jgi:hypothetical protein
LSASTDTATGPLSMAAFNAAAFLFGTLAYVVTLTFYSCNSALQIPFLPLYGYSDSSSAPVFSIYSKAAVWRPPLQPSISLSQSTIYCSERERSSVAVSVEADKAAF